MLGDVLLSQGENPQLPSALRSLTSVFGMGTGVTFSPLLPDYLIEEIIPSKLDNIPRQTSIPTKCGVLFIG